MVKLLNGYLAEVFYLHVGTVRGIPLNLRSQMNIYDIELGHSISTLCDIFTHRCIYGYITIYIYIHELIIIMYS